MNAAAWIALAGAVVVVLTNVVLMTRFISSLELRIREQEVQRKADVQANEMQRKADVELVNVKLGQLEGTLKRHENAIWPRMRGVERMVGRAHVFNEGDGE